MIRPGNKELIDDMVDIPYGLLCLGSALEEKGYDVKIIDLGGSKPYYNIPEADLYGISTMTVTYYECLQIKDWINTNYPNKPVIAGGHHASIEYESVAKDGFDYVFVGEGELVFPEIVFRILNDLPVDKIIKGVKLENLDLLKLNYGLINLNDYNRVIGDNRGISIMSSRGCVFKCKFCWTANNLGEVRFRSAESIIEEIKMLKDRYSIEFICFLDDSFLIDKKRAVSIMDALESIGIEWEAECNVLHLQDFEICKRMSETGCKRIFSGIESCSDELLNKMGKPQTKDQIRRAIQNVSKSGMIMRASLMVGFPGETWDTLNETIEWITQLPVDEYSLFTFTPFPGTDPYINPDKYGINYIDENLSNFYAIKGMAKSSFAFETNSLKKMDVEKMRIYMKERLDNYFMSSDRIIARLTRKNKRKKVKYGEWKI